MSIIIMKLISKIFSSAPPIFFSKSAPDRILLSDLLLQELKSLEWDTLGTYLGLSQSEIRISNAIIRTQYRRRRIVMFDT